MGRNTLHKTGFAPVKSAPFSVVVSFMEYRRKAPELNLKSVVNVLFSIIEGKTKGETIKSMNDSPSFRSSAVLLLRGGADRIVRMI